MVEYWSSIAYGYNTMDVERLGLTPEQQGSIDAVFLATTIDALNQKVKYSDRALLMTSSPDLPNELEAIHARTFDEAHKAVIEDRETEMNNTLVTNLARLAFIDALALPSAEQVERKTKYLERTVKESGFNAERALGNWQSFRRLFRKLAHTIE